MGWLGIVVLGVAVGLAGWLFHPRRRASGAASGGLALAVVAALAGAAIAKAAGRATGFFYDGELLEWPVCTAAAFVCVAVAVALRARR
ncbi:hypothetical protein G5S35_12840 [Paraburkholderia tropica]|jgi:uncharacterized membrane protein YeaQ/YmgE (transglycosylase-associated protein family)|uniref:hypothetical protein n=1 Tax=Paraburkholderia tropica TaxID=92647 RepID=UPI0016017EA6|nr:hypothetical protein [Paraburkholderia tropica]QNB12372.1 hypothetical protein G5S35_12840 [Paraburkholderia tropica]